MRRLLQVSIAVLVIVGPTCMSALASDVYTGGTMRGLDAKAAAPAEAAATLERLANLYFPESTLPRTPRHGTHLCTIDDDCGSGHKCCSGHCKAVSTC